MGVGPFVDRNPMRQVKMWDNIGGEVEGDFRQGGKNVKTKLTKVNTSCVYVVKTFHRQSKRISEKYAFATTDPQSK